MKNFNVVFLKIESFFDPKSIEINHIICIFSVNYYVVEVIFCGEMKFFFRCIKVYLCVGVF